jgi:hypothetical protein
MTEGTQMKKIVVFLQSCTVSLPVLQSSRSESSITCIDAYEVICVKREEDRAIDCQEDEIPVTISFPTIKCEQDEVSYLSVWPLLAELCKYPEILLLICPLNEFHLGERKFLYVLGLCETLVRVSVWK